MAECTNCGNCCEFQPCFFCEKLADGIVPCKFLVKNLDKNYCSILSTFKGTELYPHISTLLAVGKGCCGKPDEQDINKLPMNLNILIYLIKHSETYYGITLPSKHNCLG